MSWIPLLPLRGRRGIQSGGSWSAAPGRGGSRFAAAGRVVLRQVPRLRGIAGVGGLGFRVVVTP
jgi:hypothetical protein